MTQRNIQHSEIVFLPSKNYGLLRLTYIHPDVVTQVKTTIYRSRLCFSIRYKIVSPHDIRALKQETTHGHIND
jgi:hypothetical protein